MSSSIPTKPDASSLISTQAAEGNVRLRFRPTATNVDGKSVDNQTGQTSVAAGEC